MPQPSNEKDEGKGLHCPNLIVGRTMTSTDDDSAFRRVLSNAEEFFMSAPGPSAHRQILPMRFLSIWGENVLELIRPNPRFDLEDSGRLQLATPAISRSPQFARVQSLSVTMHVLLLTLLIAPALPELLHPVTSTKVTWEPPDTIRYFHTPTWMSQLGNSPGGTSGERNPLPATNGAAPLFARIQLVPPRVRPADDIRVPIPPTLVGDPNNTLPLTNLTNWGDPNSRSNNLSSGPGTHNGIGNGNDFGVGNGVGDSLGNSRDSGIGNKSGCPGCGGGEMPVCIYCPRADYTDEAVKAKYQGSVVLSVVVTADGRATDIHVSKGLGLGLDEKAVEAVRNWRFKPVLGPDGRPVATPVSIEVQFHLY